MKSPLDTQKLQQLCEAVVRNANGYNNGTIPMAQDQEWAQLCHESLPALEEFICEGGDHEKISKELDDAKRMMGLYAAITDNEPLALHIDRSYKNLINRILDTQEKKIGKLSELSDDALILMREMFAEQYRLGFEYACEQAGVNCTNKEEAFATILRPIPPDEMRAMMVHREKLEQEKQTNG